MGKSVIISAVFLLIFAGLQFAQQGYVVAGYTKSYTHGSGDEDFLIYRLDADGRKLWRRNFGGTDDERDGTICRTTDGGYVIAGTTYSYTYGTYNDSDFIIYKLDAEGRKQWRKNYGGKGWDGAWSIQQTADGGYVVAGYSHSYFPATYDYPDFLIYKLDASGNKQWRKNYGGAYNDGCTSIVQTADGGYLAAGHTTSYHHDTDDSDCLLYKLDASGKKQWRRNLGGTEDDGINSILQNPDGSIVAGGWTGSYTHGPTDYRDFLIYKLDGNQLWRKNLGGSLEDRLYSIQRTSDGGYITAGSTLSYIHGSYGDIDFLIYKLDAAFNKQWRKNLGGDKLDTARWIEQTADGGYVVAGYSRSFTNSGYDFLVYKLDGSGAKMWRKNYGGGEDDYGKCIRVVAD